MFFFSNSPNFSAPFFFLFLFQRSRNRGSIIVASRLSPSIFVFYHVAKLNHLKIHHALSRRERKRERERETRTGAKGSWRFGRRATNACWVAGYPHTFVRELMILIHQPTFRFEEDEGYETESFVNKPCGGIASSNRPNSDEFLATDFAPLTQFFRPRKIEKIVEAVFHGQRTDGQTFYMGYFRPSFLPSFLFPCERYPERRSNVDQLESIVFAWK